MKRKRSYQNLLCTLTLFVLFLSCSHTTGPTAQSGQRTYEESVRQVVFPENTVTVRFDNLYKNDIYLVKVNQSGSAVSAGSTGKVQNVSPSLQNDRGMSSDTYDGNDVIPHTRMPRMGRPEGEQQKYLLPAPPVGNVSATAVSAFVPPALNSTRSFWVETYHGSGKFKQIQATLLAIGTHSNIWVANTTSISKIQAQNLAAKFDVIYPAETNILGYEYGGGPGGNGGMDGDPRIQILAHDILDASGNNPASGYFWSKDFYTDAYAQSRWGERSNEAEIFYVDAGTLRFYPDFIYSTLVHEFQHMINFNVKYVEHGKISQTWYDEMLAMMAEDIIAPLAGVGPTNSDHVINDMIPYFISTYYKAGVTEWLTGTQDETDFSYESQFAFGAYLLRNYGGAELLQKILANDTTGTDSITAALKENDPEMTFQKAFLRYGEAMIFSGNSMPEGAMSFDKTVTKTINGYTYTASRFDIWNMRRGYGVYGPYVFDLNQAAMKPYSVSLHSAAGWKGISGSFSVTLEKPSSSNVVFYLMVR